MPVLFNYNKIIDLHTLMVSVHFAPKFVGFEQVKSQLQSVTDQICSQVKDF